MSNDFLTDDELAALEKELAELEGLESPAASVEAAKPAPRRNVKKQAAAIAEAVKDPEPVPEPSMAELEALEAMSDVGEAGEIDSLAELEALEELEAQAGGVLAASPELEAHSLEALAALAEPEPAPFVAEQPEVEEIEDEEEFELPKASSSTVESFIDPKKLKQDISFTETNLTQAYMDQASLFSFYSVKAHKAQYQADKFKAAVELLEARIDRELRDQAAAAGEKITEAAIEKRIRLDSRYQRAIELANEAKMIAGLAKDTLEAFRHRRDMLIQIGADAREEMKGSMRLKAIEEERNAKIDNVKRQYGVAQ